MQDLKNTLEINNSIEFAENRIVSRGTTFKVNETGALSITLNRDDTGGTQLGASSVNVFNCISTTDAVALRDFLNAHYPMERGITITESIVDEAADFEYLEPIDADADETGSDFEKAIKATDEYKHAEHMMQLDYVCDERLEELEGAIISCFAWASFDKWKLNTSMHSAYHGMVQELWNNAQPTDETPTPVAEWKQIDLDDVRKKGVDFSEQGEDSCICCNKDLIDPINFVRMLTNGNIANSRDEVPATIDAECQGMFPIGTGCMKKLPADFVFQYD